MIKTARVGFLLGLCSLLQPLHGFAQEFVAGEFFVDTFDDGDHEDSRPANWKRVGNFTAQDARVVNGDLRIEGVSGFPSLAPVEAGESAFWRYDDFSLTTRARILPGNQLSEVGVYGRRERPGFVYFGVIDDAGMMYLGETANGSVIRDISLQTNLRPREHDVIMKMDFQGDLMGLAAWWADDSPVLTPMLTYRDDSFSSGTIAMVAAGSGDVAFRWFEVAPVPEPSGVTLLLWGAVFIAFYRPQLRAAPEAFKRRR